MDILALLGVVIAFAAVVGGNFLEGGQIGALLDAPAAVIVIGGTLGAVILQTPYARLRRALQMVRWIVLPPTRDLQGTIEKMSKWSQRSRKEGLLGLENVINKETDAFTRKGLELLIDGNDTHTIRRVLETDLKSRMDGDLGAAAVFRAMGGYAPTIGIIGAVLGLIQVMGNLADPSALGAGIATAFVATIYGVGLANLLFLPVADRLKALVVEQADAQVVSLEGLLAIAEGEHPKNIELRLEGYLEAA